MFNVGTVQRIDYIPVPDPVHEDDNPLSLLANETLLNIILYLPPHDLLSFYSTATRYKRFIETTKTLLYRLPFPMFRPIKSRLECPQDVPRNIAIALYCVQQCKGTHPFSLLLKIAKRMESRPYFEQAMELFRMYPSDWQQNAIQLAKDNIEIIAFFDRETALNLVEGLLDLNLKTPIYFGLAKVFKDQKVECRERIMKLKVLTHPDTEPWFIREMACAFGCMEAARKMIQPKFQAPDLIEGLLACINENDDLTLTQKHDILSEIDTILRHSNSQTFQFRTKISDITVMDLYFEVILTAVKIKWERAQGLITGFIQRAELSHSVKLFRAINVLDNDLAIGMLNNLISIIIVKLNTAEILPVLGDLKDLCASMGQSLTFSHNIKEYINSLLYRKPDVMAFFAHHMYSLDPFYAQKLAEESVSEKSYVNDTLKIKVDFLKIHFPDLAYPLFIQILEEIEKNPLLILKWDISGDTPYFIDKEQEISSRLYNVLLAMIKTSEFTAEPRLKPFVNFAKSVYPSNSKLSHTAFVKAKQLAMKTRPNSLYYVVGEMAPFFPRKGRRLYPRRD